MNPRQRFVLIGGIAAVVGMCVYCPWEIPRVDEMRLNPPGEKCGGLLDVHWDTVHDWIWSEDPTESRRVPEDQRRYCLPLATLGLKRHVNWIDLVQRALPWAFGTLLLFLATRSRPGQEERISPSGTGRREEWAEAPL